MITTIQLIEEAILSEAKCRAAVAIIRHKDKWLLGLSKSTDERFNLWTFVAGTVHYNELPERTVVRESKEEANLRVKVIQELSYGSKTDVKYYYCKVVGEPKVIHNNEFAAMAFFTIREMRSLKLYHNIMNLIEKAKDV